MCSHCILCVKDNVTLRVLLCHSSRSFVSKGDTPYLSKMVIVTNLYIRHGYQFLYDLRQLVVIRTEIDRGKTILSNL